MNRKAQLGDQIFLFYFVFILLMITGGVVVGSYLTSGKEYDMRMQDSEILSKKIVDCLENEEMLTELKIQSLFSTCNLDESVFEKGIIVSIGTSEKNLFKYGNVVACGLQDRSAEYPRCMDSFAKVKLNGQNTELYLTLGSNLKSEKKNV